MRRNTIKANHLNGAVQRVDKTLRALRDGDFNFLVIGIAAKFIHASGTRKALAVFILVIERKSGVVCTGEFLLGTDQIMELQTHRVAWVQFGVRCQPVALGVIHIIAYAPGRDHLIVGQTALFHFDDMAAGGQAGNGDLTVSSNGDTVGGKAIEGHGAAHGGTGHGNSAAGFRRKAVGSALAAQIEQDVMLGIQILLLVFCNGNARTLHQRVGLNGGTVSAHGDDEHAGALRPDGGKFLAGGAALTLHVGHGVIGHQYDGSARLVGRHGGQGTVVLVRSDGQHVAGAAVDADHPIIYIRQSDLAVHKVLNGLPVAEHIQFEALTHVHIQVALTIDIQVNITEVIDVLIKAINGVLVEAVIADVEILLGDGDLLTGCPFAEGPVGNAVRMLDPDKIGLAARR